MKKLGLALLLSIAGAACPDFSNVPCAKDENCPNGFVCGCERLCVAASAGATGCSRDGGALAGGAAGGASAGGSTAGGSTVAGGSAGGEAGGGAAGGVTGGGSAGGGEADGGAAGGGDADGGATGGGTSGGGATGGGTSGGGVAGGGASDGGATGGGTSVPGDGCSSPIPLSFTGSTTASGSLSGLFDDTAACSGAGPDAVYQVTLSSPATVTAQVMASGFTPRVSVRSSCSSASTLACEAAAMPGTATAATSALGAGTYYVWVDASSATASGAYSLNVSAGAIDAGAGTLTTFSVVVMGQSVMVDQYVPAGPGPFPVVALGHAVSLNKSTFGALATALRDDGIVVVVPQFPSLSSNTTLQAQMLLASVDRVVDAGIANPANLGFGGHNLGALSAWLAAAQRPTRALVLLDPIDDNQNTGLTQVASVTAPTLWAFALPSASCNSNNNAAAWFAPKSGRKTRLTVVNANTCDPADPAPPFCALGCGTAVPSRSLIFRRYARAHFDRELLGPTLFGCVDPMVGRDVDAGIVTSPVTSLGCP